MSTQDIPLDKGASKKFSWKEFSPFFLWIDEGKFFSAKFEYDEDKMRGHNVVFHS